MAKMDIKTCIEEEFSFLESEYNFACSRSEKIDGGFEFEYLNSTTGVCITYEFREAYIFIMLYRLIGGKLIKNPFRIGLDTSLNGYGLDDFILINDPSAMVKPAYQYGEQSEFYTGKDGLRQYCKLFAINLKRFGERILAGDFTEFSEAQKIVRARIMDQN